MTTRRWLRQKWILVIHKLLIRRVGRVFGSGKAQKVRSWETNSSRESGCPSESTGVRDTDRGVCNPDTHVEGCSK